MHWIHTLFQGRWGQASPRIVDDILLLLPFSLSICLSFSLFLLSLHDSTLASCIVCPNSSNSRFSSVYYYIISSLFLYITPNIYNTTSVLSRFSFFFLPLFFSKKKPILTDCFFSVGLFFMRVCFFVSTAVVAPTAFLCRLQYVCAYVWKEKREEKHNDGSRSKKKEKLRIALVWWLWLLLFLLILTECKIIISIVMFSDQIKDYRSSRTPVL
jgi:hypothetical protein